MQDPQDRGPGYRNVVGIPGGVKGPLFDVLSAKNKDKMKLLASDGNAMDKGRPLEDDAINTVYVVDSTKLPFHEAETYHQFHNGIGKPFGAVRFFLLPGGKVVSTGQRVEYAEL